MNRIVVCLLIALLAGCTGVKQSHSDSKEASKKPEMPMGQKLALLDGKKDSAQIEIYSEEFQKLQGLCVEDEESLGAMIFGVAKMGKQAGYKWSTNLDTLKSFVQMADSGFERKPGQCVEIYSTLRKDYLEEASQNDKT
jgi:hypothetical protein